jgi:tetratricopeptide (TPR) repeat protein
MTRTQSVFIGGLVLAIVLAFTPPVVAGEGKMPITTSSKEALEQYKQGRDLLEKLRFPDARPFFANAVAADPNFALAYLSAALVAPDFNGFVTNLEKAKKARGHVSEAERNWIDGVDAGFIGNPTRQFRLYEELVEEYPNDERAHNLLATYYFGQQEYDLAVEQFEAAVEIAPEFSLVYNMLGYSYRFLARYDDAEKAFQKYIELIPDDPNPYDSYAELLLKIGRFEDAIEQYGNALKVDSTFAASYAGISTCYNLLGRHAEGRAVASKLIANAIDDGQRRAAHLALAVSYVDEGDFANAISEVEKRMEIARSGGDALSVSFDQVLIGNLLLEWGKPEEALIKYREALNTVEESDLPEHRKKTTRLGFLYSEGRAALKMGDIAKAKSNQQGYASQAKERANQFEIWNSHELAGQIAMAEGEYAAAVAEFEQANLQNTLNLYRLAEAYGKLGDTANQERLCEQVVNFNQLTSINYGLARDRARRMLAGM